jgi:hypothetical protein
MTPFMFGNPWLVWAWSWPDDPDVQYPRPELTRRRRCARRIFCRRRTPDATTGQAPGQAREPSGSAGPSTDFAPWPGLRLLAPLTEDELITFGRELEAAHDVVGRLLAER